MVQRQNPVEKSQQGGGCFISASAAAAAEEDMPMLRPLEEKVSPVPYIIVQNRDLKEDEFIVIACNDIWDVQTNQECVMMMAGIFAEGECDLGLVCEEVSLLLIILLSFA